MVDLKYRADIDGLRAIAVLAVVGFHAFPEWVKGGFIGVDIFFVLSGFLITQILLSQLQTESTPRFGAFIRHFYARRVLRIFPALIIVLLFCYFLGKRILFDDEFEQMKRHISAGAGFFSNFALWREAGYFDTAGETKPLLHLWSLAIEEQFYLIWPLALWVSWKKQINLLTMTLTLIGVSFLLMTIKLWNRDFVEVFFFPQTRVWELLCGAALAFIKIENITNCPMLQRWRNWIASAAGLVLVFSLVTFSKASTWPSPWTVLPCIAVLGLLWTGVGQNSAWLNRRVLSNPALVAIGLISYPLYLWHWPLLSFARIIEGGASSFTLRMVAIALSFVLAYLTYLLIEKPLRYGTKWGKWLQHENRLGHRIKMVALCTLMALLATLGMKAYWQTVKISMTKVFSSGDVVPTVTSDATTYCQQQLPQFFKFHYCQMDGRFAPSVVLLGDSHAGHSYQGLAEILKIKNINLLNLGAPSTSPYYATGTPLLKEQIMMNQALDFAVQSSSIKTIVLADYGGSTAWPSYERPLRDTLTRLSASGKQIVYIVDAPEFEFEPPECLKPRLVVPQWLDPRKPITPCARLRNDFVTKRATYHDVIARVEHDLPKIKFFKAWEAFCDAEWCWMKRGDEMLYVDSQHLSAAGSAYQSRAFAVWWDKTFPNQTVK